VAEGNQQVQSMTVLLL